MTGTLEAAAQRRAARVVEHRPSRSTDAMCDQLCLAWARIPLLDGGSNRDIFVAVLLRPVQRACRRPVFVFTGANLRDDGVRNQNGQSRTLDRIEPVDAVEQNER